MRNGWIVSDPECVTLFSSSPWKVVNPSPFGIAIMAGEAGELAMPKQEN